MKKVGKVKLNIQCWLLFAGIAFFSLTAVPNRLIAGNNIDSLLVIVESPNTGNEDRISTYIKLVDLYATVSLDTGLFYADKCFDLAQKENNEEAMCRAIFKRGTVLSLFDKKDEAISAFIQAFEHGKKIDNNELILSVLFNLGVEYKNIGRYDTALTTLVYVKELALQNDNLNIAFRALNSIGNTYIDLADYSKAQVAFIEAVELNKKIDNEFYQLILTNNMGNIYFYISNYEKAIEYYYKTLEIAENMNNELFINGSYGNIGIICMELKKYDEATQNIMASIDYYNKSNDRYNASLAYNSLGLVFKELESYDSALFYFEKSLTIKQEINDSAGFAMIYTNIGRAYLEQGNFRLAEKKLIKGVAYSGQYLDHYNKAIAYISLGDLYIEKNEVMALKYYNNALKLTLKHDLNEEKLQVYDKLYEYYKSKKYFEESLVYHEKHKTLNDSLHGESSNLKIEEIETRYEVDKKDNEILLLHKEQELEEIRYQKEQAKSRLQKLVIITISVFVIISILLIFMLARQKNKNKINQLENRGLKVETDMLRSQMNPHFIFNSLNSIQSFISERDTIDAERYLSKFAKLMRLILENSRESFVSLENEINTLTLYLELEALRFDNQFKYNIEINDIDDEFTMVPPMLMQPYIENAILHGVSSIKNGVINIHYRQLGSKIICSVDDNGIGRKKSAEIKKSLLSQKSSLGIKVTAERIALLSQEFKLLLKVEILDKYDEDNNASGTAVTVEMPFKG